MVRSNLLLQLLAVILALVVGCSPAEGDSSSKGIAKSLALEASSVLLNSGGSASSGVTEKWQAIKKSYLSDSFYGLSGVELRLVSPLEVASESVQSEPRVIGLLSVRFKDSEVYALIFADGHVRVIG